jgi:hypothetical protein
LQRYQACGYLGDAGEGIYDITKASNIEIEKLHYCSYHLMLIDGIAVRARFIDLKPHDGLEFAQEMMKFFRKKILRLRQL